MLKIYRFIASIILATLFSLAYSCENNKQQALQHTQEEELAFNRIISLNGSITEVLFSLGLDSQIVGVDVTSTYPAKELSEVPKLGHISQLNTEAILALLPDAILIDAKQANADGIVKLVDAGINVIKVELKPSLDNAINIAIQLQKELNISDEFIAKLSDEVIKSQEKLDTTLKKLSSYEPQKVLFLYARGMGRVLVAGKETEAAKMIALSGGSNAIDDFDNFEALTTEALIDAAPEVILMFKSGLESLDGVEGLEHLPGMTQTPAYKNKRVIAMDGHYLLGFGPRAAEAANELADHLLKYSVSQ